MENKPIRVCSIDPSISSTGIAILDIVDGEHGIMKLVDKCSLINKKPPKDRWAKKEVTRELFEFFLKDKIEHINFFIFEDYSFGSKGYLADAGEMNGLFKHYLWKHKKEFDTVAPQTIKRVVAGSGGASKEEVAAGLHKFITNLDDFSFNNMDETDAIAVAIGYLVYSREKYDPKIAARRRNKKANQLSGPKRKKRKPK